MTTTLPHSLAKSFSRTTFVKGAGALVVGFGLPLALAPTAAADAVPFPNLDPSQLDSWLAIASDGSVTVFTGRDDTGQHKETSYAQIVGDELDVPFSAITVIMGDTARVVNQGGSEASDGLLNGAKPLRHAAAEARQVLLGLAAARLGVPASQLSVANGVVRVTATPSQAVSYAELIGGRRFDTPLSVSGSGTTIDVAGSVPAQIKDPSQYTLVGQSIPSPAIPKMVTATWPRVPNVRLPGMVHARVVLPPDVGVHLVSVDGFRSRPAGLIKVVSRGDFLAVVAEEEWQAIQALASIKTTWTAPPAALSGNGEVFTYLRTSPVLAQSLTVPVVGNVDTALAGASRTFSAQYDFPNQSHGMLAPSCAVADVHGAQAICWSGTQSPFSTQASIAAITGLPTTSVRVIALYNSGAYGREGTDDVAPAAAYLSQQVGRPVKLQWMRQQEQAWEPTYPPSAFSFRAGVDATGQIVAWDHQEWSWAANSADLPTQFVARAPLVTTGTPSFRPPGGGDVAAYAFANMRVRGNAVTPQLRGAAMRSPGRIQVNFAGEQFVDEIASATGQDPIAFRLRHLSNNTDPYTLVSIQPRMANVLQTAQTASGWVPRPSPGPGARSNARVVSGRGVAIVASQRSSYIANVAEVEVDRHTGKVTVTRMYVTVDAGQIVNPTGIRAQIEGATIYSTSRALHEQVVFTRAKVIDADWVTYPILRFVDVPQAITITLLDQPTLSPAGSFANGGMGSYVNSGIGEPPNTVVPAAIGNAIFDATGVRIREAPFTPARVRAALKAAAVG